jgi:wyosine [tRNA(Phe)-imidazoG37] synthetase (radical SAM superfamily)
MTPAIFINPENVFPAQNLKGKFCLSPFVQVSINPEGEVGICGCQRWQPTVIGNIFSDSLQNLLSGHVAQRIRQSIIDGTYIYCHPERCGILRTNSLNEYGTLPETVKWAVEDSTRYLVPHHITLAMDRTCNLSCPSCRKTVIKNTIQDKEKQKELSDLVRKNLFGVPTDKEIELTMDTNGDVFASPFLLDFLQGLSSQDFPNLKIDLLSNGLLAEQRWERMGEMQNHVKKITISYDAAEAQTYEQLRRGGKWDELLQAMSWLKQKKKQNGMQFNARMVVQRANYKQMKDFYVLSKSFDCDTVQFQRIMNYGTFTKDELMYLDVCDSRSDLYHDLLNSLQQVIDLPDALFWHGIPKFS